MAYEMDAGTTVKRLESEMLHLLREKFQKYSNSIQHLLNIELVIKGDSDTVEFTIPDSTIKLTFNSENEGYGLRIFDGRDFAFISPAEISLEDGKASPLEEGILRMSEGQIRTVLELLKNAEEGLQIYVNKRREEFQEKLELISKY